MAAKGQAQQAQLTHPTPEVEMQTPDESAQGKVPSCVSVVTCGDQT